ncbi:MAG TPA: hypothetical protein VFV61_01945, partial [Pyrinomonadaceae bacterium]|nr:hypothetical protein [Pyrinomonadaceae bacterium]
SLLPTSCRHHPRTLVQSGTNSELYQHLAQEQKAYCCLGLLPSLSEVMGGGMSKKGFSSLACLKVVTAALERPVAEPIFAYER